MFYGDNHLRKKSQKNEVNKYVSEIHLIIFVFQTAGLEIGIDRKKLL